MGHTMNPTREQLWDFRERDPHSAPGPLWVDGQCLDCNLCQEISPTLFRRNDETAMSYVAKQPETEEEHELAHEAVYGCCVEAIHFNGLSLDWRKHPPMKPYAELNAFQKWLRRWRERRVRSKTF